MRKILFVIPTLGNGGAERSLVNLLCELPKEEFDVDLLLLKNVGMFIEQVPDHIHMIERPYEIEKLYGPINETGLLTPVRVIGIGLSKILKKGMGEQKAFLWKYFYGPVIKDLPGEYDVAVGYLGGESTYFILDHVNAKKKYHWVHNDYRKSGMPKKTDMKIFGQVDGIVTISEECLAILLEEFPQYKDKMYNIANITSSVVVKNRAKEFYPKEYESSELTLLSVGRLNEQKGFDFAISACKLLKAKGLEFNWIILGEGDIRSELQNQINATGVSDVIKLIGARENPYPYIKNCDIFVQPSRFEGKSVVLDEAKILAKPIIATAYPTVKDQLSNGEEGIIVDMTPEAIADGIIELSGNPSVMNKLKEKLQSCDYGNQEEVGKYVELFNS